MTMIFKATETVTISGVQHDCECCHCGRPLKLGVKFQGFGGSFGADCVARASEKQIVRVPGGKVTQKLSGDWIKKLGIIAHKGEDYASREYGWKPGSDNFKIVLKKDLKFI